MKMLLWKEWGNARRFYAVTAVFVFIPYVLPYLGLWDGGVVSLYLSVLVCAFIAGNAIAGERADRSAEFIAYLPVRPLPAIISKAIIAAALSFSFLLFNLAVPVLCEPWTRIYRTLGSTVVLGVFSEAVFLFGLGWLASSLLKSSVMSAAAGLATWSMVLIPTMMHLYELRSTADQVSFLRNHYLLAALLGVITFAAGCIVYVRRPNP